MMWNSNNTLQLQASEKKKKKKEIKGIKKYIAASLRRTQMD